jgi:hypothetical protein
MEMYTETRSLLGKCPQCQNPALYDFQMIGCHIACPICGYTFCSESLWDYTSQEQMITKSNRSIYRLMENRGSGVMWVERNDGTPGEFLCLTNGITSSLINTFNNFLLSPATDNEKSYLTRWDDVTKTVIAVVGKIHHPFGDDVIDEDNSWHTLDFPGPFSQRESGHQIY